MTTAADLHLLRESDRHHQKQPAVVVHQPLVELLQRALSLLDASHKREAASLLELRRRRREIRELEADLDFSQAELAGFRSAHRELVKEVADTCLVAMLGPPKGDA
jgi:hypothetical protein